MANSRNRRSTDPLSTTCGARIAAQVSAGQHLVVGLSGGIDSVSLLHVLLQQRDDAGFRLSALHVNHGLSPHANDWEAHCRGLCERWNIPVNIARVAVERNSADGLEAAARRARHGAYAAMPGDYIVLGHHRGDQAETLLFNLLRGTGLAGAAAMATLRQRLFRPLLAVSRSDIDTYARDHDLRWIDDESNRNPRFSRNFLRHDILAPIVARFPAAEGNLAAAAARFGEAATLLDELAQLDLGGNTAGFPVPVSVLNGLSEARGRNLLRYLLARRDVGIPSQPRLVELVRQLRESEADRHPRIRFGAWDIVRRRGMIDIEPAVSET